MTKLFAIEILILINNATGSYCIVMWCTPGMTRRMWWRHGQRNKLIKTLVKNNLGQILISLVYCIRVQMISLDDTKQRKELCWGLRICRCSYISTGIHIWTVTGRDGVQSTVLFCITFLQRWDWLSKCTKAEIDKIIRNRTRCFEIYIFNPCFLGGWEERGW